MNWALGTSCAILALLYYRIRVSYKRIFLENQLLKGQLEAAILRIAELEAASKPDGLFQNAVSALVGLGVPGLVLLAVMATSGFAGAAAITSALATLGGPAGMVGGIAALVAMGLASKALAEYGFPKLAQAVLRGLIRAGESKESIREKLGGMPRWILSTAARSKAMSQLDQVN